MTCTNEKAPDCSGAFFVFTGLDVGSDVEPEVHHVPVLDDVLLAFRAHLAGFSGTGFTIEAHIIFEGDGFGADEALFKVRMDDPSRLRCRFNS